MNQKGGLPTATMLSIGGRIESLRFRFDRSVKQFALLLEVSPETVESWERGEAIESSVINLIADKTGASLHWLIAGLTAYQVENIHRKAARSMTHQCGRWRWRCTSAEIETACAPAASHARQMS